MFKKIGKFFRSVRQEMGYVTWPTKEDLKEGTSAVVVMSVLVAVFLSLTDALFGYVIRTLLFKG
jgi:preprotein translocase subunit SecE